MRTIFHLDLDTFFVSVERILNPSLENLPVIVGGDPHGGRGVVAACSYEARKFGLHSAMPIKTAFKLCPHGIYLKGHFEEYTRFSRLVKNILTKYAPVIEQASIDEFYMDFTGCEKIYGSLLVFASFLQNEIWEKLYLPASIGIGSNKTIAKIGSDFRKPKGITYVKHGNEKDFLFPLPIEKIPGVGKATLKELNSRGFYKVGDLAKVNSDYLGVIFGKYGVDLWHKANGEGTEYLSVEREQKSISKERTFEDIVDKEKILNILFKLTGQVCQLLRDSNYQASTISIKLRYSDFKTLTCAKTVSHTDDDKVIFETAKSLLLKSYTRRVSIRLIGVKLTNFTIAFYQEGLFDELGTKRLQMIEAINSIRAKYGYSAIYYGG